MLLSELLSYPLPLDCHCTGLVSDNRLVKPGDIFCALAGIRTHGEVYIASALQQGAVAILKEAETLAFDRLSHDVPCISVPQLSQQLGYIAARFYQQPTQNMRIVGITGTNGKTTVSHLIAQILQKINLPCGLIGTLGYGTYGALQPNNYTTPQPIDLQKLFSQFKAQSISYVAMEVSSHALVQGRVNGINFDTAVFTNLSRDHLDYHLSMEAYFAAKLRLFTTDHLKTAILNQDDPQSAKIKQSIATTVNTLTYSLNHTSADVYAQIELMHPQGCDLIIRTPWGHEKLYNPLLGKFNVSNVLAALTVLLNWGIPFTTLLTATNQITSVSGRMENLTQIGQPTVIIDYAHTPDALQQTLSTLRLHHQSTEKNELSSQLWCVFGCGGDRDQGKRPLMGQIAESHADKIVITDDNPRHENSKAIINDILQGCSQLERITVIADRKQAIEYALQNARVQDIILIAGKGHETYQQIGDQRFPFSDRQIVKAYLTTSN